jgi:hypothetical protein
MDEEIDCRRGRSEDEEDDVNFMDVDEDDLHAGRKSDEDRSSDSDNKSQCDGNNGGNKGQDGEHVDDGEGHSNGHTSSDGTEAANRTDVSGFCIDNRLDGRIGSFPTNHYILPSSNMTQEQADSEEARYAKDLLTRKGKEKDVPRVYATDHRLHTGVMQGSHAFLGRVDPTGQKGLPFVFRHLYNAVLNVHHVPSTHVSLSTFPPPAATDTPAASDRWLHRLGTYSRIRDLEECPSAEVPG